MPRFILLGVITSALVLAGASRVSAQLMIISAQGTLEHVVNPISSPSFIPSEFEVSFSLWLDTPPKPRLPDSASAVYSPRSARLEIAGNVFALVEAELIVERFVGGAWAPACGYSMRGSTTSGWFFTLVNMSTSLEYAPDFSIPRSLPFGDLDLAHDVTLSGAGQWAAYGDAVITSVELSPVPEPATMGAIAALLLCATVAYRHGRHRNSRPTPSDTRESGVTMRSRAGA